MGALSQRGRQAGKRAYHTELCTELSRREHSVHCAYDTESIRSGSIRYRRYHGPQYFFTHLKLTSNGIGNYFRCCQLVCFNLVLLSIYSGPVMPDQSVHR